MSITIKTCPIHTCAYHGSDALVSFPDPFHSSLFFLRSGDVIHPPLRHGSGNDTTDAQDWVSSKIVKVTDFLTAYKKANIVHKNFRNCF